MSRYPLNRIAEALERIATILEYEKAPGVVCQHPPTAVVSGESAKPWCKQCATHPPHVTVNLQCTSEWRVTLAHHEVAVHRCEYSKNHAGDAHRSRAGLEWTGDQPVQKPDET